jgi:hypothetical protein
MRKAIIAAVTVAAIAFPATAGAGTFKGIVVGKQLRRHALIVTSKTGVVRTVHTHRLKTRIGARVTVTATKLRDGTFSARKVKVSGHARKARVHGVVAKRVRGGYLLSAGHSVLAVHTGRLFSLNDGGSGPNTGDVVDVTVNTEGQELDEDDVAEVGHAQKLELEGTVVSVTAPAASADGEIVLQVGKSTISIVVPAGTQLPTLQAGQSVQLKVGLSGSTFTLLTAHEENDDQGDDDNNEGNGGSGGGGGGDDD